MPKFICTDEYDGFYTTSDSLAMGHLRDHPSHQIIMVEHDPVSGHLHTEIIDTHEQS